MENKVNQNISGLNLDSVNWQIKDGLVTYALNANIQGFDGESFTYTNEPSNQVCYNFEGVKPGFQIIGTLPIIEQNKLVVFLTHPDGRSEIGVVEKLDNDCQTIETTEKDCGCPEGTIVEGELVETLDATTVETLVCPPGYTYNSIFGTCVADVIQYVNATKTTQTFTLANTTNIVFGNEDAVLYDEGYDIKGYGGDGTFDSGLTKLSANFWRNTTYYGSTDSRINQVAVTMGSGSQPNFWHEFVINLCVPEETVYYIALAADNSFRLDLDNQIILDPTESAIVDIPGDDDQWNINVNGAVPPDPNNNRISYERFHIYPVRLTQGSHALKVGYVDYEIPQMLAMEIYDNTPAEIIAATTADDLNIIWSTGSQETIETIISASCPDGFELGTDGNCEYGCKSIAQITPETVITQVNSCCVYTPLITDDCNTVDCQPSAFSKDNCCLNFSIEYPIEAVYRLDECETKIFFISKNNPPRKFTLEKPLGDDGCGNDIECLDLACPNFDIFPSYCHPKLNPIAVESGGRLKAGVYSFAISYSDKEGGEITDYHDLSNPIPIFERKITEQTGYETSQSIKVRIENSANNFYYFNLIVAENINEVTTYHLVGTYKINSDGVNEVVYTGDYKSTFSGIAPLIRTPHYDTAGIIEKQNDILMLADLEQTPEYNFQPFANQVQLLWETVEMPSDGKFDYSNPEVAYFFRTYQRDEVYPFGIKFKLKNGKYTDVFHIPGRAINTYTADDTSLIPETNKDVFLVDNDCIKPVTNSLPRWQVYNTATSEGTSIKDPEQAEYVEKQFNCKIPVKEKGRFSYWESTEKYPCNPKIWGDLADQPIRHHKFPDSNISHIHEGLGTEKDFESESYMYPIGVSIDDQHFQGLLNEPSDVALGLKYTVYDPIQKTYIPIRDLICGFEIVRGNRVNNKSVIAKGLVYDVGKYEEEDENGRVVRSYYYPNYPYNDLRVDPYLANKPSWYDDGNRGGSLGTPFQQDPFNYQLLGGQRLQDRFTFYSPDTSFQMPKIGTELKLETVEYGYVLGHFVPVDEHPEYKFIDIGSTISIFILGASAAFLIKGDIALSPSVGPSAGVTTNIANQVAQTQLLYDIFEKLIPYTNFAYQYNSVAAYNNFTQIPNTGNKRRFLDIGKYIDSKISSVEDDQPVHNRLRESSVYLKTNDTFIQHVGPGSNYDDSRYVISEIVNPDIQKDPTRIDSSRKTRAYYTSIKRNFVNQYGQIENIRYVSTGYIRELEPYRVADKVILKPKYYPAFGGDTFINKFALKRKHSFFTRNLVNLPAKVNDMPMDYWLYPNLAYPSYYIGTTSEELNWVQLIALLTAAGFAIGTTIGLVGSSNVTGTVNVAQTASVSSLQLALSLLYDIKKPKINIDDSTAPVSAIYKKGKFYTASYGIPIFFVESDINVDFRHGRDDDKENFYPNVGDEIPDEWLKEVNVPIKFDNFYHYNATYSAQNISPNLSYDIDDPDKSCVIAHPNRVIYSASASTTKYFTDGWQTFKRGNFFDFPKEGGRLINLTSGENELVYARFENTTKIYGARVQIESTSPVQLEVGDASMFKQKPQDISRSDLGYVGSQHKAQVRTEFGTFFVDAKRGHIYQLSKQGFAEIKSETNFNWFKQNLPFKILKYFPNVDTDNHAKGLGITMGWDERFERVFITKLDYVPVDKNQIVYDEESKKFFIGGTNLEALFSDTSLWENHSWTIAYSPKMKNFISFYSFLPNYYIPLIGNFQTITNRPEGASTWNHNLNSLTYQTYYGKLYPYILEYNVKNFPKTAVTNSITLIQDIQEYYSDYEFYSISTANNKNLANFTKAIIYNKEQSSGIVNLIPEEFGSTRQKIMYPRATINGIETLISRRENVYTFNGFWSTTNQSSGHPVWSTKWVDIRNQYPIDKVPNTKTVVPSSISYQKQKIKSDFCRVRLIQDKHSRYRFINHLQITQTN